MGCNRHPRPARSTMANHLEGTSLPFQAKRKGMKPMSATGLDVFDRTIHLTNSWLDEISNRLEVKMISPPRDKQVAWHALGAVLRAIRDRVPIELAAHLGAQLPLLVRGTFYEQWRPSKTPQRWRSAEDFLAVVAAELSSAGPVGACDAADAVFRVLNHYVDPGE